MKTEWHLAQLWMKSYVLHWAVQMILGLNTAVEFVGADLWIKKTEFLNN